MAFAFKYVLEPREDIIWKVAAFLGRYGHQPLDAVLSQPLHRLCKLQDAVASIMEGESEQSRIAEAID